MQETIDDGMYTPLETKTATNLHETIFRSEYINFLPSKIELVRNKFVFDKIEYDTIREIVLSDGYLLKNNWIIRALSLVAIYFSSRFVYFGLIASGGLENWNPAQWFNRGSLISVWGPLLLIVAASLALYQSFIKSPILTVKRITPDILLESNTWKKIRR